MAGAERGGGRGRKVLSSTLSLSPFLPFPYPFQRLLIGTVKPVNRDTERAIDSVPINGLPVLSGLNLEKM